ncbi:Cytochrome P450 [Macrophomina phaseolina MS6]|uniref:Cytochrome P450 n=1 Tax=Macrophomina phaseolina (strain MS6) TaxID=1126212 RepID=K2RSY8_MACPH|nr:Cytochrome P450 [Macrophomina phaseolina MS6]
MMFQYNKKGKAFKSPVLAQKELIILPPAAIHWLLRQSEDRVSQPKVLSRLIQAKYFLPALPPGEVVHTTLIKADLNRHLASLTTAIVSEIRISLARHWGTDTSNWHRVNVLHTIKDISAAVSTRVFFGAALAHDPSFLSHTDSFSSLMMASSGILTFFVPAALRPILGPVFALPARYHAWRMNAKLIPLIEQRIAQLSSSSSSSPFPPTNSNSDVLTHHIATAITSSSSSSSPADSSPARIAARLQAILGFAAIPTTSMTLANALLTLAALPSSSPSSSSPSSSPSTDSPASSPSPSVLLALRAEAESVLSAHAGTWTRDSLRELVRADSFIKETMRLYPFAGRGLLHEVVADDGVVLPAGLGPDGADADRIVLPKGAWLGVPVGEIQTDEEVYGEGAKRFEAWRFVGERTEREGEGASSGKGSSVTTTSDTFLSFSRGKHVCPGRFFAANVMKLVLAHVAMEYDIKPLAKRPENVLYSDISAPPDKAEIEVRRRRKEGPGEALV